MRERKKDNWPIHTSILAIFLEQRSGHCIDGLLREREREKESERIRERTGKSTIILWQYFGENEVDNVKITYPLERERERERE